MPEKKGKKKEKSVKEEKQEEMKLSDLPGIGPAAVEKLENAGIFDLMGVAVMGPKELAEMAGLGEAAARKAIQASRKMMDLGFQDGLEFSEKRKEIFNITTGSKEFDKLLGGKGLETKAITEAFGAYGSGKCVTKDTPVSYYNDSLHLETIEKVYNKYKDGNEFSFEEGSAVPVKTVKVMCFNNGILDIKPASHLYKEKVKKIFEIKTARGRTLKITGNHQLLGFDKGFKWNKVGSMKHGDLIACPKKLNLINTEDILSEDDAYFLGFFVAEGTSNPFSICNNNQKAINWIVNYVKSKYGYSPTVRIDAKNEKPVKTVLLRNITKMDMFKLDNSNSSNKFIPEIIFNSSEKIIRSFLTGYLEGLEGDVEIVENILTATTKSKVLAIQLNYLFLRLGISSSMNKRIIDSKTFYNVYIVGEDREKINSFPFKFKNVEYQIVNSKYGYPRKVIDFFRESYRKLLGECRGRIKNRIGKRSLNANQAYRHLTKEFIYENINEKSFKELKNIFVQGDNLLNDLIELLNGKFDMQRFREIVDLLPFVVNSLAKKIGLSKKSIQNYYLRKLPDSRKEVIKSLLMEEILKRKANIVYVLKIINNLENFGWDWIVDIKEVDYDDYVYDFVVPEGYSFVGGNLPTMMHNTQIGLTIAVNAQLPVENGGAEGKVVFIDTEGTFRPERIRQIAEGKGLNPENVLKNILVARAFNSDHQMLLVDKVGELIKDGEPVRLVIIDSLTAHFRAEFSGRGQLADRQQKLNKYLHNLMKMAEQFNLAVYVTNQVMSNPAMIFGDPTTPIGGNILGHACLTGDSLIQLADGSIKEIRNMKHDSIISGDFQTMKFNNSDSDFIFVNPNIDKVYEIQTTNQIKCSSLHRFFTVDNFSIIEKEAGDLNEGDFVMQADKINIECKEQKLPFIKTKRIGNLTSESFTEIKEKLKEKSFVRKEICEKIGITPREFIRVLNQSYPTSMNVLNNLQNSLGLQLKILPVYTSKHQNLIIPQIMDSGLAQVCGYFLGNGNFELNGLRFRDERSEVLNYYKILFKSIFKRDGKIFKMKNKNCFTLNINSKEISDFFRLFILDILNIIGKFGDDVVKSFIKGFVDAEGYINKKRAIITVAQKDRQILKYLQLFLLRFGIRSFLRFDVGKKKMNVLSIRDRSVKDYLDIGFTARDKQEKLLKWIKHINDTPDKEIMPVKRKDVWKLLKDAGLVPSLIIKSRPNNYNWINKRELEKVFNSLMNVEVKDRQIKQKINFIFKLLNSDFRFEKIKKINISENKNKELFYDFSVPEKENYLANGFIVHNSTFRLYIRRGKKGSRVAKLIDSPNLPDNECVFFIIEKGVGDEG